MMIIQLMWRVVMNNTLGYTPLGDGVLVKPLPVVNETKSGLLMRVGDNLEIEQNGQTRAEVVTVGPEAFQGWPVKPVSGDKVITGRYAGQVLCDDDDCVYRLCADHEIRMVESKIN